MCRPPGLANVDAAINATAKAGNNHTLNGQDTNNFAPRVGFAYSPLDSNRLVIRGGFGVFYDRPSAAFINTVFSNYPFLREIEITVPSGNVPIANAFAAQPTTLGLNNWLPFRIVRGSGSAGTYVIRDNTGVTADARGNATVGANLGNIAETFEFRAIDRNLKTPFVQQWNLGAQYEVTKNLVVRSALRRHARQKSAASDRVQSGLRPERSEDARSYLRAFQPGLRRGRRAERRVQRWRNCAGARTWPRVRFCESVPLAAGRRPAQAVCLAAWPALRSI